MASSESAFSPHSELASGFVIAAPLDHKQQADLSRKLAFLVAGTTILALAYVRQWFLPDSTLLVGNILKALAALVLAWPLLRKAAISLFDAKSPLMSDQLVALAVVAAIGGGEFSTAALVLILLELGHFLEQRSVLGARAAISGLKRLHATKASLIMRPQSERCDGTISDEVIADNHEQEIDANELRVGDRIAVRPGELIAADGTVLRGVSLVDESSITGESNAAEATVGRSLFAGTLNLTGLLEVQVDRVGASTTIGRIAELLSDASQSKAPVVRILERYAAAFVPLVLIIAAIVLFATHDLSRAITVLIVSCPGAFVLSGPAAMVAALAAASRSGILIKNSRFLEVMSNIDTVIFDKTGTVTDGAFRLHKTETAPGCSEKTLLEIALAAATGSRHPLAQAIVAAAATRGISLQKQPEHLEEIFGKGVRVSLDADRILMGRGEWIADEGAILSLQAGDESNTKNEREKAAGQGFTDVWVARNRTAMGRLLFADGVRAEARKAVEDLRALGVKKTMLATGDQWEVAHRVGDDLSLDAVTARLLPEEKLEVVRGEKASGATVMVVGDGVNDALALSAGDVGVAVGNRVSDIAIKSSDVALMKGDLSLIPAAILLSRQTRSIINQNVLASGVTALVMILLSAGGILSPLSGAILHNAGEIFVVLNSARLLRFQR